MHDNMTAPCRPLLRKYAQVIQTPQISPVETCTGSLLQICKKKNVLRDMEICTDDVDPWKWYVWSVHWSDMSDVKPLRVLHTYGRYILWYYRAEPTILLARLFHNVLRNYERWTPNALPISVHNSPMYLYRISRKNGCRSRPFCFFTSQCFHRQAEMSRKYDICLSVLQSSNTHERI